MVVITVDKLQWFQHWHQAKLISMMWRNSIIAKFLPITIVEYCGIVTKGPATIQVIFSGTQGLWYSYKIVKWWFIMIKCWLSVNWMLIEC